MATKHKENPWCRYADDDLVHCKSYSEAKSILGLLEQRFKEEVSLVDSPPFIFLNYINIAL